VNARLAHALEHPEWLPAVLALVAITAFAVALARLDARRRRRALLGPDAPGGTADRLRDGALLLAFAAVGLALLGPRVGERSVAVPSSGVDVVFLVDVSRSMDARDVPPSRMARAKRGVEELLARLGAGDRAALAVFASRGVLLTPLTPDREALGELLSALDTGLVHPPGSNLGDGLRAALEAFAEASERPRVVFVLSDGEDPELRGDGDVARAARAGVRVLAAALGSDRGAEVPDHGVPLRDERGRVVRSRRELRRLARLAEATGGAVFPGDAWGAFDFDGAAASLRRDAGSAPGVPVVRRVRAVRVLPLAAAALGLLLAEALAAAVNPLVRKTVAVVGASALAVLLLGAAPTPEAASTGAMEARLRRSPRDPALWVELGLARLERGESAAAGRAFAAAAVVAADARTAAVAYYDLGVSALARGDLGTARDAFFDALALEPRDLEARFNLEWTLQGLAARPPSAARAPGSKPDATEPPPLPREARPEPRRQPAPSPTRAAPVSEAERAQWLARVDDDPARSLRSATGAAGGGRRRHAPAW
jgi:Ca-activated chloride channel family protein